MTSNKLLFSAIYSLATLLTGCNAEVAPTEPPSRKLIQDIVFEDAKLAACVQRSQATYADEIVDLVCANRGTIGPDDSRYIHSIKGIEELTALEKINFYNNGITTFDAAKLPRLTTLNLGSNPINDLNVSQNAQLKLLYASNFDIQNLQSKPLKLDLRGNQKLEELYTENTSLLLLPANAPLRQLSFKLTGNMTLEERQLFSGAIMDAGNGLLNIDLSPYTNLKYVNISGQLNKIILAQSDSLEQLFVAGANTLKTINVDATKNLSALALPLAATIEQFDVSKFSLLQNLTLSAPGLRSIDLQKNPQLKDVALSSTALTLLDLARLPLLKSINLNTPKMRQLNLAKNTALEAVTVGDGELANLSGLNSPALLTINVGSNQLEQLNWLSCTNVYSIAIGANQLTKLDTTGCPKLDNIVIGDNKISELNLSGNQSLSYAFLTNPIEPTHLQLSAATAPSVIHNPTSADLVTIANVNIPDVKLRNCIVAAAMEQGVVYVKDLKRLACAGIDQKEYWQSLGAYASGAAPLQVSQYVFSVDGLEQFSGLEYLDLSINWIDRINLNIFPKLKTVKLDGNVIQELAISTPITSLSIDSCPLTTLTLPTTLEKLSAVKRIKYLYTSFALNDRVALPRMLSKTTQQSLTEEDYRQPVNITNLGQLIYLTDFNTSESN